MFQNCWIFHFGCRKAQPFLFGRSIIQNEIPREMSATRSYTHMWCYTEQCGHIYCGVFHNVFGGSCQKWLMCIFIYENISSLFTYSKLGEWEAHLLSTVGFHSIIVVFGSPNPGMNLLCEVCFINSTAGIRCKNSINSSSFEAESPKSFAGEKHGKLFQSANETIGTTHRGRTYWKDLRRSPSRSTPIDSMRNRS